MTKLHIFDMDGTLLRSTASVEISKSIGAYADAMAVEEGWRAGQIGDVEFWERCLPLWENLDDRKIDTAFSVAPWMEGVADVFADIAMRGEHSVVITQSPQFFVDRLLGWGAEKAYGTQVTPGFAVTEDQLISAEDKVSIVVDLLSQYGLNEPSCVAYGDSTSDVPLFEWLPHTVAVNAGDHIRRLARTTYEGTDLRAAYRVGRELLLSPIASNRKSPDWTAPACEGQL